MTAVEYRPTMLSSCARAATASEARYRIQAPIVATRASRIIALDGDAAEIVREVAELPWTGDAHFLTYESSASVEGLGDSPVDATLRTADGQETLLSAQLDDADVTVMVATSDDGAQAASIIGQACFMRGVMTAGLVVAEGGMADRAVAALRPDAMVLVVTQDEGDVPDMLTALRV